MTSINFSVRTVNKTGKDINDIYGNLILGTVGSGRDVRRVSATNGWHKNASDQKVYLQPESLSSVAVTKSVALRMWIAVDGKSYPSAPIDISDHFEVERESSTPPAQAVQRVASPLFSPRPSLRRAFPSLSRTRSKSLSSLPVKPQLPQSSSSRSLDLSLLVSATFKLTIVTSRDPSREFELTLERTCEAASATSMATTSSTSTV